MAVVQRKNRATKPYVPNSKIMLTVPLGGKIRQGKVIIAGSVTLAGGTTSGVKTGEGGPINLVKRVIITATPEAGSRYPGGKIVDCSARSLLRYAISQHSGKFIGEQSGSTLGDGAAATYPVYLSIPVYFADATLRNSYSTALNTDKGTYASLQVQVDTGDVAACFDGNDRVPDYTNLTVQWVDDRIALTGDTNVRYQEDHVKLIYASEDRALDDAMPRDGAFESWLIMAEKGGPGVYTLDNSLFTKLIVEGPTIGFEQWAQDVKQSMLDDEWADPAQDTTGLYFIDWTDSVLQNTIPAAGLEAKFSVVNVSGAALDNLLIMTRRVFAPAPAK